MMLNGVNIAERLQPSPTRILDGINRINVLSLLSAGKMRMLHAHYRCLYIPVRRQRVSKFRRTTRRSVLSIQQTKKGSSLENQGRACRKASRADESVECSLPGVVVHNFAGVGVEDQFARAVIFRALLVIEIEHAVERSRDSICRASANPAETPVIFDKAKN